MDQSKTEVRYCNVDRLFYIYRNDEVIHYQKDKPNDTDIIEALMSDNWKKVFESMEKGETVRVSERIYYDILGCVPPIKQTAKSFFCGEAYSGNLHHFFFKENGKTYGQLKSINQ